MTKTRDEIREIVAEAIRANLNIKVDYAVPEECEHEITEHIIYTPDIAADAAIAAYEGFNIGSTDCKIEPNEGAD